MSLTLESTRFGVVDIDPATVIEFPAGLIGLGGTRYTLLAASADAPFYWLHSLDDGGLALPVTDPRRFFADFRLELAPQDAERLAGAADGASRSTSRSARRRTSPTWSRTCARRS